MRFTMIFQTMFPPKFPTANIAHFRRNIVNHCHVSFKKDFFHKHFATFFASEVSFISVHILYVIELHVSVMKHFCLKLFITYFASEISLVLVKVFHVTLVVILNNKNN